MNEQSAIKSRRVRMAEEYGEHILAMRLESPQPPMWQITIRIWVAGCRKENGEVYHHSNISDFLFIYCSSKGLTIPADINRGEARNNPRDKKEWIAAFIRKNDTGIIPGLKDSSMLLSKSEREARAADLAEEKHRPGSFDYVSVVEEVGEEYLTEDEERANIKCVEGVRILSNKLHKPSIRVEMAGNLLR